MPKKRKAANPRTHFFRRMRKHFGTDPAGLVLVSQSFAHYQRANVHMALTKLLSSRGVLAELEGIIRCDGYDNVSLAKLSREYTAGRFLPGPVEYHDVELANGERLACVERGIYWVQTPTAKVALLITDNENRYPPAITIEVIATDRETAGDFGRKLSALVHQALAFRGNIMSLELDCNHALAVKFHRLPKISRRDIILPADVLRRIDRQTLGMVQHADRLRRAGRHMKRGVLLHGPPGTGKTLSAMYMASQTPGRTVLILTGGGMNSIEASGTLARALAPVTIIVEDVDLIGTMREHQTVGANALLFELLNQMDGLAEDADVLFVLTTNRPDVLEPALSSRPGRIDQAIEVPLPDAECRGRLIELYASGIDLRAADRKKFIDQTHGVSAAFIREWLRRATVMSLEAAEPTDGELVQVADEHLEAALDELTIVGGRLTNSLLGVAEVRNHSAASIEVD